MFELGLKLNVCAYRNSPKNWNDLTLIKRYIYRRNHNINKTFVLVENVPYN